MEIRLQIADKVYQALVASGNRVRGSIGLVNPKEGNFNAWKQPVQEREPGMRTIRLAHGKATVSKERARLTLSIERPRKPGSFRLYVFCNSQFIIYNS